MNEPNLENVREPIHEANKIRLARDLYNGSFLLLEGPTDKRVFGNLIDTENCRIIIPPVGKDAKNYVVDTIAILNEDKNFSGAVAIVDNDFWVLENYEHGISDLLTSEFADLETMLICSPALNRVLNEVGKEEKQIIFTQTYKDILEHLLTEASKIGYLRWYNKLSGLSLKFKGIEFKKFTDKNTLEISMIDLIRVVKNNSEKPHLSEENIIIEVEKMFREEHQKVHICCGHDIVSLLTFGLRKVWGSNDSNEFKDDIIDTMLRLAFDSQYFLTTNLYTLIKNWEEKNSYYNILKINA